MPESTGIEPHLKNYRPFYRALYFCEDDHITCHFPNGHRETWNRNTVPVVPTLHWLLQNFLPFANAADKTSWALVNGDYFQHAQPTFTPDEIKKIEQHGLRLFMYEPLFICNADGEWPWQPQAGPPCFPELENISAIFKQYTASPITVYLTEMGLAEEITARQQFDNLHLRFLNSFALETVETNNTCNWKKNSSEDLLVPFISLNFRYEACREIIVAYLQARGHLDKGHVSFFHHHERAEMIKRLPFAPHDLKNWAIIERGIKDLQPRLPLTLETSNSRSCSPTQESIPDINGLSNLRSNEARDVFYRSARVCLFTESRPFSFRGEISEKTLDAIYRRKPFLIFAAPFFIQQLRDLGFKTFGSFWNESFDTIIDPAKRLDAYLETLDSVLSWTPEQWEYFSEKSRALCEHNWQWAHTGFVDRLKSFI